MILSFQVTFTLAYSALGSNYPTQAKTKSEMSLSLESKYNDLLSQVNKVTRQLESVKSNKNIDYNINYSSP